MGLQDNLSPTSAPIPGAVRRLAGLAYREVYTDGENLYGAVLVTSEKKISLWRLPCKAAAPETPSTVDLPSSLVLSQPIRDMIEEAWRNGAWV